MEQPTVNSVPALAVKLTPSGQKRQQGDPNFLIRWIENNLPKQITPTVVPMVAPESAEGIARTVGLAARLDPNYQPTDFTLWYEVSFSPDDRESEQPKDESGLDERAVPFWFSKVFVNLENNKEEVETLHLLVIGPPPAAINIEGDDQVARQGYLGPAPAGIGARYAWTVAGGDGKEASLVDCEQGWNLNHVDLIGKGITMLGGPNYTNTNYGRRHGTCVLGVIAMQDNRTGGIGIAPAGEVRVVSEIQNNAGYRRIFAAIQEAIANMNFGDILLLEGQEYDPVLVAANGGIPRDSYFERPIEIAPLNWEVIRLATALGITVIEPAANKGVDLDLYVDTTGKKRFLRGDPGYQDSGAVMVGAGTSADRRPLTPKPTNSGSRLDCFSWGEKVLTTDSNDLGTVNNGYYDNFNSTSSASAIIAGAAMTIQSVAKTALGYKLSPSQVRKLLSTIGTQSKNGVTVDKIGFVQPDLKKILENKYINKLPNLYIRDFGGDSGLPISNPANASVDSSPDIIVQTRESANPDVDFGQTKRNSLNLSQNVIKGRDHWVYIRAQNRGGSPAINAHANVYWSEPSTSPLVQPQLWLRNRIGDAQLQTVPTNNVMKVSSPLRWPASRVPDLNQYAFVAIAGAADDGTPVIPQGFPDFAKFVLNNNNVAQRNFNVITAPPVSALLYHIFPFNLLGAFDEARIFSFLAIGSLPTDSRVFLKIPYSLSRILGIVLRKEEIIEKGESVRIPLHAFGTVDIGEGLLEKNLLVKCELQVEVPKDTYYLPGDYEFAISQVWEGTEIGRLTYRFGQLDDVEDGRSGNEGGKKCGCTKDCHESPFMGMMKMLAKIWRRTKGYIM